jgi:hypothetical protein
MAQRLFSVVDRACGQSPARGTHKSGNPAPCSSMRRARLTPPSRPSKRGDFEQVQLADKLAKQGLSRERSWSGFIFVGYNDFNRVGSGFRHNLSGLSIGAFTIYSLLVSLRQRTQIPNPQQPSRLRIYVARDAGIVITIVLSW